MPRKLAMVRVGGSQLTKTGDILKVCSKFPLCRIAQIAHLITEAQQMKEITRLEHLRIIKDPV